MPSAPVSLTPGEWLDQVGYNLLAHEPERATSLGVDTGAMPHCAAGWKTSRPKGKPPMPPRCGAIWK